MWDWDCYSDFQTHQPSFSWQEDPGGPRRTQEVPVLQSQPSRDRLAILPSAWTPRGHAAPRPQLVHPCSMKPWGPRVKTSSNAGLWSDEKRQSWVLASARFLGYYCQEPRELWTGPSAYHFYPRTPHVHTPTLCVLIWQSLLYWGNTPRKCDFHRISKTPNVHASGFVRSRSAIN